MTALTRRRTLAVDVPAAVPGAQRVRAWFAARGWAPVEFQCTAWDAYLAGHSGLIHAPTGLGKSYAAWMGPLIERLNENDNRAADAPAPGPIGTSQNPARRTLRRNARPTGEPIRILWITPMRALASDTVLSLQEPVTALGLPWTIEKRTGDTAASLKKQQRERLPTCLVTTPESLTLILSYPDSRQALSPLRCVIVDEWHELLGTKRGVQTELALARLRAWAAADPSRPPLRTWGLSATLGNLDQAARTLLGTTAGAPSLIRGILPKRIDVDTLRPDDIERFPWAGHMGLAVLPQVVSAIERAGTTLLFTNTRAQAEIWFKRLMDARPDWLGAIAIHHGSLDRDLRARVEDLLKAGRLRCVVCTSSLDLGVDFSPVDQVIQVGSPKGVARLIQRAGRSGHRPGVPSRILGVPTHAMELVEFAAVRDAVAAGQMESRTPLDRPIDVLVQHLVTIAAGGGFVESELLDEVRTTAAFAALSDQEWSWAMDFVRGGGRALRAYPQYARITPRPTPTSDTPDPFTSNHLPSPLTGSSSASTSSLRHSVTPSLPHLTISSPDIARRHRMAIGTITGDAALIVKFTSGRTLGTIEESFISRIHPGDRFVFAGRIVELVRIHEMTAFVRRATSRRGVVPRWNGGKMPLSTQLAAAVRDKLDQARRGQYDGPEMAAARPLLELQAAWSLLPAPDQLLIEEVQTEDGHHAFVFPCDGRLVQEGLAALLAYRLTRRAPQSVLGSATDYGLELFSDQPITLDEPAWRSLLSTDRLLDDLLACLNSTQLARRQFRDIARVAGLVVPGMPGTRKPMRHLQASSEMFFDVFAEFDPGNLLLDQARREVLENQLEFRRLRDTLDRAAAMSLVIRRPGRLTPFAFPIWAERLRSTHVTSETWSSRISKMVLDLEEQASHPEDPPPPVRKNRKRRAAAKPNPKAPRRNGVRTRADRMGK